MSHRSIKDSVTIITGASAGIGRAAARRFARSGARLVLAARSREPLEELAREIEAYPGEALAVPTDVTRDDDVARLVDAALTRFSRIDILICNAGVGLYGNLEELPLQAMRDAFEVNFFGVVRCIQSVLPAMKYQQSGLIQIISSIIGRRSVPGYSGYCSTKFALYALAESLIVELQGSGVAVQTVYPGLTETEFARNAIIQNPRRHPPGLHRMPADTVARHMLRAARRRTRDHIVTPGGRLLALLNGVAPGLVDAVMGQIMRAPQDGTDHALRDRRQ